MQLAFFTTRKVMAMEELTWVGPFISLVMLYAYVLLIAGGKCLMIDHDSWFKMPNLTSWRPFRIGIVGYRLLVSLLTIRLIFMLF